MRKTTAVVLALCAVVALAGRADDPEPPDDAKQALKKLRGAWTVTRLLSKGGENKMAPPTTYAFDGDRLTTTLRLRKQTYRVKIDTKKKPHTIELVPEQGKSGRVGIYKIEKGELHLALVRNKSVKGDKSFVVPKDFKGHGAPVLVLTREKGGK